MHIIGIVQWEFMESKLTMALQARRKVFVIGAAKGVDPDKNVGGGV